MTIKQIDITLRLVVDESASAYEAVRGFPSRLRDFIDSIKAEELKVLHSEGRINLQDYDGPELAKSTGTQPNQAGKLSNTTKGESSGGMGS